MVYPLRPHVKKTDTIDFPLHQSGTCPNQSLSSIPDKKDLLYLAITVLTQQTFI